MTASSSEIIYRGHVIDAERSTNGSAALRSFPRGALHVDANGKVAYCGPWQDAFNGKTIKDFGDQLILPGFVDTHLHFPQMDMIGSHGEDLLGWLNRYTFPFEERFSDRSYAEGAAKRFVDSMLNSGTTHACVFSSSHFDATDAVFSECDKRGMRAIIGQVSMNRHCPDSLVTKDLKQHERDFYTLRDRWHKKSGRLGIAVTPRFAPSCTDDLLKLNAAMAESTADALIQTHYAESKRELDWIFELYPKSKDYLGVYEDYGLITANTVLAHSIHISADERKRLKRANATVSHCPSSNMFLGSGTMNWQGMVDADIRFAFGSDVGAGTSFSLWRTMGDAYKMHRLSGTSIPVAELFARATVDGSTSLKATKAMCSFSKDANADFQVIDWSKCHILTTRMNQRCSVDELLFAVMWHWESVMTREVFIAGTSVHKKQD